MDSDLKHIGPHCPICLQKVDRIKEFGSRWAFVGKPLCRNKSYLHKTDMGKSILVHLKPEVEYISTLN